MEYIPDKQLYFAVKYANELMEELNRTLEDASRISANYHHVKQEDVIHYLKCNFNK